LDVKVVVNVWSMSQLLVSGECCSKSTGQHHSSGLFDHRSPVEGRLHGQCSSHSWWRKCKYR